MVSVGALRAQLYGWTRKRDTAARIQGDAEYLEDEWNYLAWCRQRPSTVWPDLLALLKTVYSGQEGPPSADMRPHRLPAEPLPALTAERT